MANDLITTNSTAESSALRLPTKLASLVEGDESLLDLPVCSVPARERLALTLAAEEARPMVDRTLVDHEVGTMAALLPAPKGSVEKGELYLAGMADAMNDVPADLFVEACRRARRRCRFMPSPAELREQVTLELGARRIRMMRMRFIIERHDREGGPAQPVELVDGSEVTALLSDVRRSLTARGERVPKLAGDMPARVAGPARMPTAEDMADLLGITVQEAQERMDRAALPDAPAPAKPAAAGGALNFAVRAYCDAIEQGASPADPELAAFYEANHWAVETENERRMLAGEPRKQRAA